MIQAPPNLLFALPEPKVLGIKGSRYKFPVNRIFCVGRNFPAHAAELGQSIDKKTDQPNFFMKDATHLVNTGAEIDFALGSNNFQYEIELVACISKPAFQVTEEEALDCIYGWAVGLDLTRRDLQFQARRHGAPWEMGSNFEDSAVVGTVVKRDGTIDVGRSEMKLSINGKIKQRANTSERVWNCLELLAHLSKYYHLQPGDLIFTGTPDGVGRLEPGDSIVATIGQLSRLQVKIKPSAQKDSAVLA